MAAGDVHMNAAYPKNIAGLGGADWDTNSFKVGIMTNAVTPGVNDSDPRWGTGGSQNYSTAEVTPGGNYSAGGASLAGLTITLSGAITSLNCTSPISVAANASNPTGAYWGAVYDSTDSGKHVVGFIDLGGPVSLVNGLQLNVNSQVSGTQPLFQFTAS